MSVVRLPGTVLRNPRDYVSTLPDADIRRPLWEFTPAERPHVIHERRRRFPGAFESEEIDPTYH